MSIQESDEFKVSKFYCKTDFGMATIKRVGTHFLQKLFEDISGSKSKD